MFVVWGMRHAMHHNLICGLSSSTVFFHIITLPAWYSEKSFEHKICVLNFSKTFVWNISHSKNNWARYDQKCILVFVESTVYSCQILMKLALSWQILEKYSNTIFHENPPCGFQVVPCGRMDRWDKDKRILHNVVNEPKKVQSEPKHHTLKT